MLLRRTRRAISELMSALILIAITLIAGAAVFGWVNGQTTIASQAVGNQVAANNNFLNEHEVITSVNIISSMTTNIWLYNNGKIPLTLSGAVVPPLFPAPLCPATLSCFVITLATSPYTTVGPCSVSPGPTVAAPSSSLVEITLACPSSSFASGSSYTFLLNGAFGSTAKYTVGANPSITLNCQAGLLYSPCNSAKCSTGCTIYVAGSFFPFTSPETVTLSVSGVGALGASTTYPLSSGSFGPAGFSIAVMANPPTIFYITATAAGVSASASMESYG